MTQGEEDDIKEEVQLPCENGNSKDTVEVPQRSPVKSGNVCGSFLQLNDAADEFFDAEPSDYENSEIMWPDNGALHFQVIIVCLYSSGCMSSKIPHDE